MPSFKNLRYLIRKLSNAERAYGNALMHSEYFGQTVGVQRIEETVKAYREKLHRCVNELEEEYKAFQPVKRKTKEKSITLKLEHVEDPLTGDVHIQIVDHKVNHGK